MGKVGLGMGKVGLGDSLSKLAIIFTCDYFFPFHTVTMLTTSSTTPTLKCNGVWRGSVCVGGEGVVMVFRVRLRNRM